RAGVSTPPPYPLWTPYPPAATRAEPWTQKQKVAPGVWLKKLFTARQMYCASLFPGAIRPALRLVCAPALAGAPAAGRRSPSTHPPKGDYMTTNDYFDQEMRVMTPDKVLQPRAFAQDRKSTRLNSSHVSTSYA